MTKLLDTLIGITIVTLFSTVGVLICFIIILLEWVGIIKKVRV